MVGVGCALAPLTLEAQAGSCLVRIQVEGADSLPLADTEVSSGTTVVRTDSAGRAVIGAVPPGQYPILMRRLGFAPFRAVVNSECGVASAYTLFRLAAHAQTLSVVTVRAAERRRYAGPMAGFWERRERGDGTFFTAAEIDRRNVQRLADLLRTVSGWGRSRSSEVFSDALVRGTAIRMGAAQRESARTTVAKCFPTVVIDGMAATMAELNVEGIDPRSLAGVEVYPDGARTPSEFWGTGSQGRCGVVAVWSRSADNLRHTPLEQQAALIDTVFEASEVDEPARMDDAVQFQVLYPRELRRTSTAGDATISLIVLPTGEPFLRSAKVVSATHAAFGTAMLDALGSLRFAPARRDGKVVTQRAVLTVRFDASKH